MLNLPDMPHISDFMSPDNEVYYQATYLKALEAWKDVCIAMINADIDHKPKLLDGNSSDGWVRPDPQFGG